MKTIVALFFALAATSMSVGQVHRSGPIVANDMNKLSLDNIPPLDITQIPLLRQAASQSSSERVRSARYDSDDPTAPPLYDAASKKVLLSERSIHYLSKDPVPASTADVVVTGTILSEAPHVSLDGTMLYSTFTLAPLQLIKGALGSSEPTLERIGGVALFPNGSKHLVGESGIGLPEAGHKYLLFLKRLPGQSFQIESGYCIDGERPISLDIHGDRLEKQGMTTNALLSYTISKARSH